MFKDIVKASRSYRGYDESYRFRREELEDFVDCARFAPSSVNAQPFRYYLAWEKEEVDRIQKLTNWARALPEMQLPHPGKCPTGFIIICQDLNLGASIPIPRRMLESLHRPCFSQQLRKGSAVVWSEITMQIPSKKN